MKPMRLVLAALALIGLAGCYTSEKPLVTADEAVAPYARMTFQGKDSSDTPAEFTRDGTTYVTTDNEGTKLTLLLKPVEGDYYVAQLTGPASGDPSSGDQILFAYLRIDVPNKTADAYRAFGEKKDARPGLRECKDVICVDDLAAYVAYAKEQVAAGGPPDTSYTLTVEE
jgi:hypothetical protein